MNGIKLNWGITLQPDINTEGQRDKWTWDPEGGGIAHPMLDLGKFQTLAYLSPGKSPGAYWVGSRASLDNAGNRETR